MTTNRYEIAKTETLSSELKWHAEAWNDVASLGIDNFRVEGSDHHPQTNVKVVHDGRAIGMLFQVRDSYVRAVEREFQGAVCRDSCVEFFVRPTPDHGYFNFEINCGGVLHTSYIEDWTRVGDDFGKRTLLTAEQAKPIVVRSSLPAIVDPERMESITWTVFLSIPLSVMETFVGPLGTLDGRDWTANFYKCGDDTSHPHWAAWSPVAELNFHCPECFGNVHFL